MKFLETITNILNLVNDLVWGPPLLILLVGTGIYVAVECIKNYANKCNLKRTSKMSYLLSIDNELGESR